jgi:hypothetical protein
MNSEEDNYYATMYTLMQAMVKYAEEENQHGCLGNVAKKVIQKTGKPGTLFAIIKYHLFGEEHQETEYIELQH